MSDEDNSGDARDDVGKFAKYSAEDITTNIVTIIVLCLAYAWYASVQSDKSRKPPATAEFIAGLFATSKHKNALLGDLEEKFQKAIDNGASRASAGRLYWSEMWRTILPLAWIKIKQMGPIGAIIHAAKRLFSF